ncbi:MAG: porin [Rhizobiaceae bacterium]
MGAHPRSRRRLLGGEDRTDETYSQYSRLSLQTWTGTETELGTLNTYTETRFEWASSGSTATSLNYAWIQLGGFRVGKDRST